MDTTTEKQDLATYLQTLGLTYTATFKPTPQPADTVKNPQLHWSITIERNKRTFECPYSEGIGHIKGYQQFHKTPYDRRQAEARYRKTCETGKLYGHAPNIDWDTVVGTQPSPKLADVLYCVTSDADVLNSPTYEEWASAFGYDPDSRKGEAIYRACLTQSLALKRIFSDAELNTLRELFQDY